MMTDRAEMIIKTVGLVLVIVLLPVFLAMVGIGVGLYLQYKAILLIFSDK